MTYTEDQLRAFDEATKGAISLTTARIILNRLDAAGITVTFPESRFYVKVWPTGFGADVRDRWDPSRDAAHFFGEDAERYAREHADKLNREVGS